MEFAIEIYQTEAGKRPFSVWLKALSDKKAEAAIRIRLKRLEFGNFGNCDSVGSGINELKIDHGPGYRIYFTKIGLQCVLLLCGGNKRSQKSDIDNAKKYFADYKSRGEKI